jgi:hypothetical protein
MICKVRLQKNQIKESVEQFLSKMTLLDPAQGR